MFLFAPDLSYALLVISGIWLLTGLVRLVKAGLSLFVQQPKSAELPSTPALPGAA
jgi:hypothetical protein